MTTTEDSEARSDAVAVWYLSAYELAALPRAVTEQMRRQHHRRSDGRCAGPHGPVSERWPCSTWHLAATADEVRSRR